jgi:adenylosuccinate synthase
VHEIFDQEHFEKKLRNLATGYKKRFGDLLEYDVEEEIARFREYREKLPEFVVDAVNYMQAAQASGVDILIEGANALMLDIDYGTYPFVTSSNTGLGGVITGLAVNPRKIKEIIGVAKAYTTRVGEGIFKTEDVDEAGQKLQEIGREWGVSTGRKRRCGWLDLVVLKYSASVNYYTAWNVTKLDVLDTFPTLKVAVAYKDPETGKELDYFPADLGYLERCEVVYKEFEGWQTSTTAVKTFADLPPQAQTYVKFVEEFTGVPVKWIGTGPARDDMIYL